MNNRIVTATFHTGEHSITSDQIIYQYNYGNELHFVGLTLPSTFEVHFANDQYGESTTAIGTDNVVAIPDIYLQSDKGVYAWVFLHDTENDGETKYQVYIEVEGRAEITENTPTPVQQDVITEAIAALNSAVSECEGYVSDCESNVAHYPEIINNYWYVWDAEHQEMVSTEIKAVGTDGVDGRDGRDGRDGTDGQDGVSPTISVGSTTTGEPGTDASVVQSGTSSAVVFSFTIPKGEKGDDGDPGDPSTLIDDTSTASNKVWSAEKLNGLLIADITNEVFGV